MHPLALHQAGCLLVIPATTIKIDSDALMASSGQQSGHFPDFDPHHHTPGRPISSSVQYTHLSRECIPINPN